jgi:hypothetical protein
MESSVPQESSYEFPDLASWKLPPILPVGDPDRDVLYHAVGYALSSWEALEWTLATLYSELLGAHNYAAERSYGLITTASVRANILGEVLDIAAHEEQTKDWADLPVARELLRHYRDASVMRNYIAHGLVSTIAGADGRGHTSYVVPAGYNTRQMTSRHSLPSGELVAAGEMVRAFGYRYALTSNQIHEYRGRLEMLWITGSQVVQSLREHWHSRRQSGQSIEAPQITVRFRPQ